MVRGGSEKGRNDKTQCPVGHTVQWKVYSRKEYRMTSKFLAWIFRQIVFIRWRELVVVHGGEGFWEER